MKNGQYRSVPCRIKLSQNPFLKIHVRSILEKFVQHPTVYLSIVKRPAERKQEVLFRIFQLRIVTWSLGETCTLETVPVPHLVEKPNCVKVPKEICVDIKANPSKVAKPITKEWCYHPSYVGTASTKEGLDLVIKQL